MKVSGLRLSIVQNLQSLSDDDEVSFRTRCERFPGQPQNRKRVIDWSGALDKEGILKMLEDDDSGKANTPEKKFFKKDGLSSGRQLFCNSSSGSNSSASNKVRSRIVYPLVLCSVKPF